MEVQKKRFEVMCRKLDDGTLEKAIFIDGEKLDYSIDITAYMDACRMGPAMKLAVQRDIERHFTESVSEVVGRKLTIEDIKKALKNGWI